MFSPSSTEEKKSLPVNNSGGEPEPNDSANGKALRITSISADRQGVNFDNREPRQVRSQLDSELTALAADDRKRVLQDFNATNNPPASDQFVHELFAEHARNIPDAVAAVSGYMYVTYATLDSRANRLARLLQNYGVGPEKVVAVCIERSIDLIASFLAIQKVSAAYLPLEPGYPLERLKYMIRDSAPAAVLATRKLEPKVSSMELPTIWVDLCDPAPDSEPYEDLSCARPRPLSNTLAYIIYTSGSTGMPKGVMVEQRNLCNLVHWYRTEFELSEGCRCSCVAAIGFDASVWEICSPLCFGGTLVLAPPETQGDPDGLLQWLSGQHIDVTFLPTPVAEIAARRGQFPIGLKILQVGGDRLRQLDASMPFSLVNNYGPTETTVVATSGRIFKSDGVLHIGRPVANTQVYIVDEELQPVPIGTIGELYIGGSGVARQYRNLATVTAERFVADPFSGRLGARVYRSGDVARWRNDGTIEFIGRNDDQVKVRGFRIELGEIEAQLKTYPGIEDAVAVIHESAIGDPRIVSYICVDSGNAPRLDALREYLRARLPDYMVPSAFVPLDSLPLTHNGKLDRRALPVPSAEAYVDRPFEAPRTKAEETLAAVWGEVLKAPRIGRQDGFFELGGHSLSLVDMLDRLRVAGYATDAQSVYTYPVLSELAGRLTQEAAEPDDVPPNLIPLGCTAITPEMLSLVDLDSNQIAQVTRLVPGGAANIQDIYPLAPLQEGILFHHKLDQGRGDTYVLPILVSLSSEKALHQLIQAIQVVINRHDILRTAFIFEGVKAPVQVVYRSAELPVERVSLDPGRDALAQLKEMLSPQSQSLDLQAAPLIRMLVSQDNHTGAWYALLQMHHVIADHESVETMFSEVKACIEGQEKYLPGTSPFRNHVARSLKLLNKQDSESFFKGKLGEVTEPTAPFGLLNVHGDGGRIERASASFDPSLSEKIRVMARKFGVTPATLFHAAWALVISHICDRDDVVFGTVLLGRLQGTTAGARSLGMFINTLPLRIVLRGMSIRQLVAQTQRELVELLNFEQASLVIAQRSSGISGNIPLFTTLINFLHSSLDIETGQPEIAPGMRVLASQEWTSYPIAVSIYDRKEDFGVLVKTDRQLDPENIISHLLESMRSMLNELELHPEARIHTLPLLPTMERKRILERFQSAAGEGSQQGGLVHRLFEGQAEQVRDRIAVEYGARFLTFGAANRRANQIARFLRRRGVGPDRLVGLSVGRGPEMLIGMLGIMKAGGAYLPLDPDYPSDRLAYMIHDASPTVVLTERGTAKRLPETEATVVTFDGDRSEIDRESSENPDPSEIGLRPEHLIYVIYTSGSTGRPKGVMVDHHNVSSLWQSLEAIYLESDRCEHVGVNASYNFDASVKQFIQILSGRTIYPVPDECRLNVHELYEFLERSGVQSIDCTPSQLKSWLAEDLLHRPHIPLSVVLVGGESIDPELWSELSRSGRIAFYNIYGPTECTVDTTVTRVSSARKDPSIGPPMQDARVYLVDRHNRIVPVGATGEICIGGVRVSRGYLSRADSTAAQFVADPYTGQAGARMYKTGDVARWHADGTLEHLGRNDHQVKIRGFRVELGEIEAQLSLHPCVRGAAVLVREGENGLPRLTAYVAAELPRAKSEHSPRRSEAAAEMIDQWKSVHNETYLTSSTGPSFVGWDSTYTGHAIPVPEMEEWLAHTVQRIKETKPRKVLEIGCGVGLILQHVAPTCTRYVATDFSVAAVEQLKRWVDERGELRHVQILSRTATDFEGLGGEEFDLVILNSVVQYFPDLDYLLNVLRGAIGVVAPGGKLFVGDVRNLELLTAFHSAVQLGRATATINSGQLRRRVARALAQEKELVIDPQFFRDLPERIPGIGSALIRLKRGRSANELTRYRYDVVLEIGTPKKGSVREVPSLAWQESVETVDNLDSALAEHRWSSMYLHSIPNARVVKDVAAQGLIERSGDQLDASTIRRQASQAGQQAIDPESVLEIAFRHGYCAEITWNAYRSPECFDAWFSSEPAVNGRWQVPFIRPGSTDDRRTDANNPLENALRSQVIPELKEHLRARVPDHMIPSVWVVMKQLPLTPSGKVDRRALPEPEGRLEDRGEYVAPQTDMERGLAELWAQLLQVDQIGLQDNFFELGGHSLLAMQVVVRIRGLLSIDVPMRLLFEHPTLAQLTPELERLHRESLIWNSVEQDEELEALIDSVADMPEWRAQELIRELRQRSGT